MAYQYGEWETASRDTRGMIRQAMMTGEGASISDACSGLAGASREDEKSGSPHSSGTGAPKSAAPPQSCDCHMHVYDSRFPVDCRATLRPADALVGDYRKLQRRLGTSRNVVVTPSTYGTDNSCLLDALAQLGNSARGVAVVDTSVTDVELKRLSDVGVRGIRFNLTMGSVTSLKMIEPLARHIADYGWHVQINMPADDLSGAETMLTRLPVPIVFDHLGHLPLPQGVQHPGFAVISRLLERRKAWVKLSGAYIESRTGAPDYEDSGSIARAFISIAPDRLVWGSDWPHPTQKRGKPDDAALLDLLRVWVPDDETWRQILVASPAALYGF